MYITLAVLILTPVAIITGLIYAFKKLSRGHFLLLILLLLATPFTVFKIYEREFILGSVPDELGVNSISYSEEESWGFGPGGNEAGIRLYPLPEEISREISEKGLEFFDALSKKQRNRNGDWHGVYSRWSETPIKPDKIWQASEGEDSLDIYDYICRYGFCIDIKPAVVVEANSIVNSAGSYYAYGRTGLIIVSPLKNIVLYIYNG